MTVSAYILIQTEVGKASAVVDGGPHARRRRRRPTT